MFVFKCVVGNHPINSIGVPWLKTPLVQLLNYIIFLIVNYRSNIFLDRAYVSYSIIIIHYIIIKSKDCHFFNNVFI